MSKLVEGLKLVKLHETAYSGPFIITSLYNDYTDPELGRFATYRLQALIQSAAVVDINSKGAEFIKKELSMYIVRQVYGEFEEQIHQIRLACYQLKSHQEILNLLNNLHQDMFKV